MKLAHLSGHEIQWRSTTDNLYQSFETPYLNVSPFSHIGILRSGGSPAEITRKLFWQYYHATNWQSALVMLRELSEFGQVDSERDALGARLKHAATDALEEKLPHLARWRLTQARGLLAKDERDDEIDRIDAQALALIDKP
jgi:hypothetical protein